MTITAYFDREIIERTYSLSYYGSISDYVTFTDGAYMVIYADPPGSDTEWYVEVFDANGRSILFDGWNRYSEHFTFVCLYSGGTDYYETEDICRYGTITIYLEPSDQTWTIY